MWSNTAQQPSHISSDSSGNRHYRLLYLINCCLIASDPAKQMGSVEISLGHRHTGASQALTKLFVFLRSAKKYNELNLR